jgi:hypothetical protein
MGTTTGAKTFTITNDADSATGALTLMNNDPTEITASGCGTSLAGHASCTLTVTFTARMLGSHTGKVVLSASSGQILTITLIGAGAYRLTVTATGNGTVTSLSGPVTCNGASCTGLFAGKVILHSVPGPDQLFAGWSGGGCPAGVVRDCSLTLDATTTIGASFVPQTDNLAFVTDAGASSTLGAATNYDKRCNDTATAAGFNNSTQDAFVALVSTSTSDVAARIGNARGWQRLDGRPVMDTLAAALTDKKVFNAVMFTEKGTLAKNQFVLTGIGTDGRVSPTQTCADFTTTTGTLIGGFSDGGAGQLSTGVTSMCMWNSSVLCLGKTRSRTVKPTVTAGKLAWITSKAFEVGNSGTPDSACQAELPSGVTKAAAFISTQARPGSAALSPATVYVRPDGTLVGTGAQLASGNIESGIWQEADGTYSEFPAAIWTGSTQPSTTGTSESTCVDWTLGAAANTLGASYGWASHITKFWYDNVTTCGSPGYQLYCVQTAP